MVVHGGPWWSKFNVAICNLVMARLEDAGEASSKPPPGDIQMQLHLALSSSQQFHTDTARQVVPVAPVAPATKSPRKRDSANPHPHEILAIDLFLSNEILRQVI